jgi:uncharacterized protein (DUF433 family)
MTPTVRIVDYGRGPQIENNRLTVMDVFYYIHRGHDWDFIQNALPRLNRAEFDAVVEYVSEHRKKLIEMDNRVEERNRRGIEEERRKGLRPYGPEPPFEVRYARLKELLRLRKEADAAKNEVDVPHFVPNARQL